MGWKKLEAKKFACIRELNGISARTMEEHYELYKGYVSKTNEIQEKLDSVDRASANQIYSDLRALRVDLSFATGVSRTTRPTSAIWAARAGRRPDG